MSALLPPFQLTTQLMRIPSVTGNEAEVGEFLSRYLADSGYRAVRQEVEPGRSNVLAFADEEPTFVFCTHIDTVPPFLPVSEDNDFIRGRGACDTKGIIAAMLEAGVRLRASGIRRFGYLFVVGEEVNGAGAKAANNLKWNSQYVVVGEPTRNLMARAQKGTFNANLGFTGRAAHSGYPEEGVSAISGLWRVLQDCESANWGDDPVLGRGTFNVGVFQGGERANIVPGKASASIMIRTIEERLKTEGRIRGIVGDRATIDVVSSNDPHLMHVIDGFETTVVSFGSDVPFLGRLGKPILVGPGSILDAHTADEKISKQELMDGIDLYERLARKLCE